MSRDIDFGLSGVIPIFSQLNATAFDVLKETAKVKLTHHNKAFKSEPYRSSSLWLMRRCVGINHLQRILAQSVKPGVYLGGSVDFPFVEGKLSPEILGVQTIYMPSGVYPSLGWESGLLKRGMFKTGLKTGTLSDLSKLATSVSTYTYKWAEDSNLFVTAGYSFDITNRWRARRPGFRLNDPPLNSRVYNGSASFGVFYPFTSTLQMTACAVTCSDESSLDATIREEFDIAGFGLNATLSAGMSRAHHAVTNAHEYHIGIGLGLG